MKIYSKKVMKRSYTADYIKVMQAYVEGKQIQYKDDEVWIDIDDHDWDWHNWEYRIKPEPNYRPFRDVEECWQEMQKHRPFGWIKNKNNGHYAMITKVNADFDKKHIAISGINICTLSETMCDYTFADGEPFGINIEDL